MKTRGKTKNEGPYPDFLRDYVDGNYICKDFVDLLGTTDDRVDDVVFPFCFLTLLGNL